MAPETCSSGIFTPPEEGECCSICVEDDFCVCIETYDPVCGSDGETYSNDCYLDCANVEKVSDGRCGEEVDRETEVEEADCSDVQAELETCNSDAAAREEQLLEAYRAIEDCQAQLPVDETVQTYTDVSADCVTPSGEWAFGQVSGAVDQTLCVVNNQIVVVEDDGKTYPTCVQYYTDNTAACDTDNLICGEMNKGQVGWPNQITNQLNVALTRADYKHPECPTIQTECGQLSSYWTNFIASETVFSEEEALNVCASSAGMLRVVHKDHYVDTCVGYSEFGRQVCPNDRNYVCAGNDAGTLVYGWPGQIVATLGAALSNADGSLRHPQCSGLLA